MSLGLEDLKAHLEKDGARYVPPFLLWLDDGEIVLGHVAGGVVVSSGALSQDTARELAAEIVTYADAAAAEAAALSGTAKPEGPQS